MTVQEFRRLVEAGIIDKVEFIDDAVMGDYPLAFSPEQVAAAAELGIDLSARAGTVPRMSGSESAGAP